MSDLVDTLTILSTEHVYDEFGHWVGTELSKKKFAKLLINYCAVIARDVADRCDSDDFALDRCYEIEDALRQLIVDL